MSDHATDVCGDVRSRLAQSEDRQSLNRLREGVTRAIETFGTGFLSDKKNSTLHAGLKSGELDSNGYYLQVLRLVYRLIFLFIAEDRGALLDPQADEAAKSRYRNVYAARRLRAYADTRQGEPYRDVWKRIRVVMTSLNEGCPELALPALGSPLWSSQACPALMSSSCGDEYSLEAIHYLSSGDGAAHCQIDWSNVRADELGSVYEGLLDLQPLIDVREEKFHFQADSGHARKNSGSYYTPAPLIDCLLESSLDPVLDEAVKKPDAEYAILSLRVCDPACGPGNFLIAAARRIGKQLAGIRTGDRQPNSAEIRRAFRDVVDRCIFGVDVNPVAVEICKIGLSLEAIEPGRPLPFLDSRIQCGNALLGSTAALMEGGIPDSAFDAIDGEHSTIASQLRKRNQRERTAIEIGQRTVFEATEIDGTGDFAGIAKETAQIDRISGEDIADIRSKSERWLNLRRSSGFQAEWFRADAWCAAFVWPKQSRRLASAAITAERWRLITRNPGDAPALTRTTVRELADRYRFFHWHLAFPQVFGNQGPGSKDGESCASRRGFDVVIGNPPFVNAIEGGISQGAKAIMRGIPSDLGGTADLSFRFVELAHRIVHENGRIGLVQPKTFLNSVAALSLRQKLSIHRPPVVIYVPGRAKFFGDASTYVCLLVLARGTSLQISDAEWPTDAQWRGGSLRDDNWWRGFQEILGRKPPFDPTGVPMGSCFHVAASMTAGEAYAIKAHVREDMGGDELRLITTGLIDPFVCKWGRVPCRYLGKVYRRPCVSGGADLPAALIERLRNARRPKVLIAGLANRVEAYVDSVGNCCGAVSTFSVFHSEDSIDALAGLGDWLNGERATALIRGELGAASVGGNYMTIKKQALSELRVPEEIARRSFGNGT